MKLNASTTARTAAHGWRAKMRAIDADALEKEGWSLHRTIRVDKNTEEYQTKQLRQVPTIEPELHWIKCSERLPEEGERVLATHLGGLNPNRQVIEHIYQNGEFTCGWEMDTDFHSRTFGQRFMGNVIAWMPLPECYQEDI